MGVECGSSSLLPWRARAGCTWVRPCGGTTRRLPLQLRHSATTVASSDSRCWCSERSLEGLGPAQHAGLAMLLGSARLEKQPRSRPCLGVDQAQRLAQHDPKGVACHAWPSQCGPCLAQAHVVPGRTTRMAIYKHALDPQTIVVVVLFPAHSWNDAHPSAFDACPHPHASAFPAKLSLGETLLPTGVIPLHSGTTSVSLPGSVAPSSR